MSVIRTPCTKVTFPALALAAFLVEGGAVAAPTEMRPAGVPSPIIVETELESPTLWESTKGAVSSIGSVFVPPSPGDFANSLGDKESSEFWKLLDDAGYSLKEVETSVGIIPGLTTTFKLTRELSEADREWVEREMDQYARRDGSLVARLQRSILNVLLEASEMGKFKIEKLEVSLLPLPKAKFLLTPTANILSEDHDVLYRMLESIKKKIP